MENLMPPESILAHVAPFMGSQIENVATDALAHLLQQYVFIKDAFLEYVASTGIDLPNELKFKPQGRSLDDSGIPDLVGRDKQGHYLLIVESKFWAPLTPHQPTTYIERLHPDKPAILLFIAPASRMPTLWKELLNRCSSYINSQSQQETATAQFHILRLNSNHILALTSWESLLADLHKAAQQTKDEYALGDIWQLQSLCTKIDAEAFHPLSDDDITSPPEMRIRQFRSLIDKLVILLFNSGIVTIDKYHPTRRSGYYKRYMSIRGFPNWCIEFNESYRKKYPPTNLWLTKHQFSGLSTDLAPVSYCDGKYLIIPLEIPIDVEEEDVLTSLLQQVTDVSERLINQ